MPKIVVTFAVRTEFTAWRRLSPFVSVNGKGTPIYLMRNGDSEVYAVMTGIGARSVQDQLREFLASADLCIVTGLAGSLINRHPAGAVLVAKAVKHTKTERTIKSDAFLVQRAIQCGAAAVDFFLTSSAVVNLPAEKSRLGEIADAVEMESFHIFAQAEQFGVPSAAVRAISDGAETRVPIDFNRVIDNRGQIRWPVALYEAAKTPMQIPPLIRFGLKSSRARRNLAWFLDRYIKSLVGDLERPRPELRKTSSGAGGILMRERT